MGTAVFENRTTSRDTLRIHAVLPGTRTLGPHLRFGLWVQGCTQKCRNCMTPDARPFSGGKSVSVERLAKRITGEPDIEGITISGGEPFLQAAPLHETILRVRLKRDLGVIVYSGYPMAVLEEKGRTDPAISLFLSVTDLLIDGPYIQDMDDGLSLRGSANQEVRPLTPRYEGEIEKNYGRSCRNVEWHLLNEGLFLAGIPGRQTLEKWKGLRRG